MISTVWRKLFVAVAGILALVFNVSSVFAQSSSADLGSLVLSMFSNPSSLMVFLIELALGFGLGYFSAKAIKYFLAIVGIFFVGVILNVWAAPGLEASLSQQLSSLGLEWSNIYIVITSIIYVIGLTTVLPITVGFIIGIVMAVAR